MYSQLFGQRSACLFLLHWFTEKYDGRGQIIIERGQFFRTNLHGAVQDRPHFKIMKRGHLTS